MTGLAIALVKGMNKPSVEAGRRFGRLVVAGQVESVRGHRSVVCRCDCGSRDRPYRLSDLIPARVVSCGCRKRDQAIALGRARIKHGHSVNRRLTTEYGSWRSMRTRCENPRCPSFPRYGGRGITVCERWMTFENFLADMGSRPTTNHSLDRIDNDKGYEPGNVRWATRKEQARNVSTNRRLLYRGESKTIAEWSEVVDVGANLIAARLRLGWSVEAALSTPVAGRA